MKNLIFYFKVLFFLTFTFLLLSCDTNIVQDDDEKLSSSFQLSKTCSCEDISSPLIDSTSQSIISEIITTPFVFKQST